MPSITRREFVSLAAVSSAGLLAGCLPTEPGLKNEPGGRLGTTYKTSSTIGEPGLHYLLKGDHERAGRYFIPEGIAPGQLVPLMVLFHGAGGTADLWFGSYTDRAQTAGMALLAPDSIGGTWDRIRFGYGPDLIYLDSALAEMLDRCPVDPARMYVGGFSDGASYALSVGLTNGDLFSKVVAYSPGMLVGVERHGNPRVFISHGTNDTVLPIDRSGRRIASILGDENYDVKYVEFNGDHAVPASISTAAFEWLSS